MTPLQQQFADPLVVAVLSLYVLLAVVPLIELARAERRVQVVALALALASVALRCVRISETPPGLGGDDAATLFELGNYQRFGWRHLFGQFTTSGGMGWCLFPWYILYRLGEYNLLAMREFGMAWNALLVIQAVVVGTRWFGLAGGALTGTLLAFTPWALFLSRFQWGPEVLLQQLYLLQASVRIRERSSLLGAVVAGLMMGALQYTYLAARIAVVTPLVFVFSGGLPRRWKVLLCLAVAYVVAFLVLLPHVLTDPPDLLAGTMTSFDGRLYALWPMAIKLLTIFASLYDLEYAQNGTLALKGVQVLSPLILILVVIGVWTARRQHGLPLLALVLAGAVPCWVSQTNGGSSHRMMMMLVPIAVLVGASALSLPARWRTGITIGLVVAISLSGTRTWLSPPLWRWIHGPMLYALPLHQAARAEIARSGVATLRMVPYSSYAQLVEHERHLPEGTLETRDEDFRGSDGRTILWQTLPLERGALLAKTEVVEVVQISPFVALTYFPFGIPAALQRLPFDSWLHQFRDDILQSSQE